jgi:hypothetical protein
MVVRRGILSILFLEMYIISADAMEISLDVY